MTNILAAAPARRNALRALTLVGTALGSVAVITPAWAQNQTFNGPTTYQNGGTISGGPTTVSANTSTGDITLDLNTVTAAVPGSGTAAPATNGAIYANNTGPGAITIKDVNASVTGSGAGSGILALAAGGGPLSITQTGVVDATNAINSRGITASSNGGAITIVANEADGGFRGIYTGPTTNGKFPTSVNITVNTATATGAGNGPNAIIAQGDQVTLTSGTAALTNAAATNGTAIFVNAGTSATVKSGIANAFGMGQAAILAAADGTLNLTSTTVRATQNSDGISIQGSTPTATSPARNIAVNSNSILLDGANSGVGIVLGGNHGGNFSSGASGLVYTSANVTSGSITTAGANSYGIFVTPNGAGTTTITSRDITTGGSGSIGIYETAIGAGAITGGSTINSTGTLSTAGANAHAIYVSPGAGTLAISNMGAIRTTGSGADGVFVSNANGPTTVTNAGSISTSNANAFGVYVTGTTGATTVNSSGTVSTTGANAQGINVSTTTGAQTVNSGTVTTSGNGAAGLSANTSGGAVSITSANVTTSGDNSVGINARQTNGGTGAITVSSTGTLATAGAGSHGIFVSPGAGSVAINNNGAITTTGSGAAGVFVANSTGPTTVTNAGSIGTSNANAFGIYVTGTTGPTTVNSTGSVTGSGANGQAINITSTTGSQTITSTSVATTGLGGIGINLRSTTGALTVNSGTLTTTGVNATGIFAQSTAGGNVAVTAGTTTSSGGQSGNLSYGIIASSSGTGTTGTVTVNSGAASALDNAAIFASGGGSVNVTSGTATSNSSSALQANSRLGDVSVVADTTSLTRNPKGFALGSSSAALQANATVGNVVVRAGTVSSEATAGIGSVAGATASITAASVSGNGDGFAGVNVTGGTGVTLNIGAASSTGALTTSTFNGNTTTNRADAIFATARNGAINATIGSATATGAGADAVRLIANGTGGAVTAAITGAVSSTGGYGLYIDPPGANTVTMASGASVTGLTGVSLTGATNTLTNAGMITGTAGPGVVATGATMLDNSGAIAGSGGVAVQLGASDDGVTLRTGSMIAGAIAGGGGNDSATLVGTANTATANQQVASFTGFSTLAVQSGYWTASAGNPSAFSNSVMVASNTTLDVANGANGIVLSAPSIVNNGALVVRGDAISAGSTFGSSVVAGSGSMLLTGGLVTLDGTNSLQNTGNTMIANGTVALLTGSQAGTFINNGTLQIGNGGTTGNFTGTLADNGTVISNRSDSYTFVGALNGAGTFVKNGAGTVTFGTNYAFTGVTQLNAGSLKLSTSVDPSTKLDAEGNGTYDLSGVNQTIAQLSGSSTGATINIAGDAFTVNQATNTSFAGSIVGAGSLTKTGTGSLNLTGTSTYAGPTTVSGGRLAVNGSITSPVIVNNGGTLGGNGSVGAVTIASGGTYAPGNSIGTQTVNGNVTFAAGSTFAVEANGAGQADRVNATGTATLQGGTVAVTPVAGTYANLTNYTILTAAGGVTGNFAAATSSDPTLSPFLAYGGNAVTLTLARNNVVFTTMGANPNQTGVGAAVTALGVNSAIYRGLLPLSAAALPGALGQLSGELYASLPSVLADGSKQVREAVLARATAQGEGFGLWAAGTRTLAGSREQAGIAPVISNRWTAIGGVDFSLSGLRLGVDGGYIEDQTRVRSLGSHAKTRTTLIGGHVGFAQGPLSFVIGGDYAWHKISADRALGTAGFPSILTAGAKAHTTQGYGEVGYGAMMGNVTFTPFARFSYVHIVSDALTEGGGLGALTAARDTRNYKFGSLGLRMTGDAPISENVTFQPRISAAYTHGWNVEGSRALAFAGTGASFTEAGAALARDAFDVNAGFDLAFAHRLTIGVGGFGSTSKEWSDYGAKASIGLKF